MMENRQRYRKKHASHQDRFMREQMRHLVTQMLWKRLILIVSQLKPTRTPTQQKHGMLQNTCVLNKLENLKKLTKLADKQSEKIDLLQKRVGHYSLKNINKRDETAQKNLQLLRDAQRLARKKTRDLEFVKQKFSVQREQNEELGKNISKIQCDIQCMADRLGTEVAKKVSTQKSNSKLRQQLKRLRQIQAEWTNGPVPGLTDENEHLRQQLVTLTNKIQESDILINNHYFEIDELKDKLSDESTNTTKLEDGSFSDNMRLCVIQLSGLEVATEKN
ncbi:hypothetical protein DPMN_177675 [Dreissena polymorpha]|uniref:Uncharacterized protein n=1 Tax=Dreissena polymorpha TaxID=45954 RepID=A0A9D4IJ76_DREPO|nr:hypothetical protein DPMN_177675 [Dreissena polymorpha]